MCAIAQPSADPSIAAGTLRLNPFVVVQSGVPFDITTGTDLYGTTLFNARPGFATDPNQPGVIQTAYGLLGSQSHARREACAEKLRPRTWTDFGEPAHLQNLRFWRRTRRDAEGDRAAAGASGWAQRIRTSPAAAVWDPSLRRPPPDHRYNFSVSLAARNVLNHTNPGPIVGDSYVAFVRTGQSIGGNAQWRRLFRERRQSPAGAAIPIYVLRRSREPKRPCAKRLLHWG